MAYPEFVKKDEEKYWDEMTKNQREYLVLFAEEIFPEDNSVLAKDMKERGTYTLVPLYELMTSGA